MRSRMVFAAAVLALVGCEFEASIKNPDVKLPDLKFPDGGIPSLPDLPPGDGGVPPGMETPSGTDPLTEKFPPEFLSGEGFGADCDEETPCRGGLSCTDGECAFDGETEPGDFCVASGECDDGQCLSNQCVPAGDAAKGEPCQSSAECEAGLRCGVVGFSTQCIPDGETDLSGECESSNECLSGLTCFQPNPKLPATCTAVPGAPPAVPTLWEGVECDKPSAEKVRAYFEIPGAPDADEGDYFRLPFPNDVMTDSKGRVDVSGFPTPGVNPIVGVDPIEPYVDAVDGMEGWGTNGTAIFRFSGPIDFGSFNDSDAINWVDITDPEKPVESGVAFTSTPGSTNYVCHNAFSVRRANGRPMEPGRTYAVWLAATGQAKSGLKIEQAENFSALLEADAPENKILEAAHEKYAPFREYLESEGLTASDVLVATVITVGPARDLMSDLAAAVRDNSTPATSAWTKCGEEDSPCPQAKGSRACDENDAFDEYHALIDLPIFQEGKAPYMKKGGKITTDGPVRTEPVCASLTIPKGVEMPPEGWPSVVFTHGTGGSFRSHVRNGIAEEYSAAETPDGTVNFAVLGFDQVQHGPRRGDSEESPDNLFFNFLNPDAAQGNPLQGAADVISVGRVMAALSLTAEESGGDAFNMDPARIVYFGHSQGAMHGSLGLPFANEYQAAVLSGNGASLMHAMLTKTAPVDIASAVPLIVNDGVRIDPVKLTVTASLPGGAHHPALTLIQQYIDPADPLNFARQIAREPLPEQAPRHVFQTYGQGDNFSPPLTMEIYARAGRFSVVEAHSSASEPDDLGTEAQEFPLTASFGIEDKEFTAGIRQYGPPAGKDGHFVVFDVSEAKSDAARFLGMAAAGLTPQIGK